MTSGAAQVGRSAAPARPRISGERRRVGPLGRGAAAAVAGGCLGVLLLASRLTPDAAGHGTHTQLGMPPCAWAEAFDKPCMTCGMTTAFAYAGHGDLLDSVRAQPFGFLLAVGAAATAWGALHVAVTGSMLAGALARLLTPRVLWSVLVLALGAWAYKLVTWQG